MKKLLFATAAVFCLTFCNAQNLKRSTKKPISNTTVQTDLRGKISSAKVANGNVKIRTESGKYDVYATYKNNKLAGFYAIDTKGNKIPATISKGVHCEVCIKDPNPTSGEFCYTISCDDLPDPKKNAGYKQ